MINEGVYARAYARALFLTAVDRREVERVTEDLGALEQQWNGSPELRRFCSSHLPGCPADRAQIIERVWGGSLTQTVKHLLGALAQRDQLRLVPQVIARYQERRDRAQSRSKVAISFACEPRPEEVERIRQLVADSYGPAMTLSVRVVPELIAGVRFVVNDKRVDASLAGRLARLRHGLMKPMQPEAAAS